MAESDPKIASQDWFAVRKRNARAGLRKLVSIVAENRTDRAEAPLPLHKSIYTGEARNAAEMEHIFRNEPIVVGLSGDIPRTGDTLVFDSVGPSILVARGKDAGNGFAIDGMVEKPAKGTAPSNLYINGRYILQPEIFPILAEQERGAGNEIQLTDAMLKLQRGQDFYGFHFHGRGYDCGSPEGFVEANLAFALERPGMRERLAGTLKDIAGA